MPLSSISTIFAPMIESSTCMTLILHSSTCSGRSSQLKWRTCPTENCSVHSRRKPLWLMSWIRHGNRSSRVVNAEGSSSAVNTPLRVTVIREKVRSSESSCLIGCCFVKGSSPADTGTHKADIRKVSLSSSTNRTNISASARNSRTVF